MSQPTRAARNTDKPPTDALPDVPSILAELERLGTKKTRDGMARYGISTDLPAYGVTMADMNALAKSVRKSHDAATRHALADGLWKSRIYEARLFAPLIDDPALVTRQQMTRWTADFDNWAVCDTACFKLFDQSPLAWKMIPAWSKSPREFVKRSAFALLASLVLHDKSADDALFAGMLPLIERAADDDRNFVKKGVSWALRSIARKSPSLRAASLALAKRLAESPDPSSRWIGKDALRDLSRAKP